MKVDLTEDEIETVRALIADWGYDYELVANPQKVEALALKLGVSKYVDDVKTVLWR